MATTITLDSGNNSFSIKDGFLGNTATFSGSIKGSTIDGLGGKDTVDTTKQGYAFPDSDFKLTVDGTGVVTLTTSSGSATFRNFEQIKYTNLVVAVGATGDDVLSGTAGADVLLGVGGNDILDGSTGADSMYGGAGNDTYVVDNAADQVIESNSSVHFDTATRTSASVDAGGIDTVQASVNFTLGSLFENLTLTGTAANGTGNTLDNALAGNAAANLLTGDAGNDTLDGGAGTDTLSGGAGNDTYVVDSALDVVQENTGAGGADAGGTDTVQSSASFALGALFENLSLTGSAATGTGNALANQLRGNAAANTLDGGAGNDSMLGGAGNDTYIVDSSLDVVQEFTVPDGTLDAGGSDTVQATVNYTLGAFIENLTLGGAAALSGTGNGSVNLITGNAAANKLFGLGGADTLQGGAGNDSLDGGLQTDVMRGGAGNDTYVVNVSTDVADETTDGMATDAGGIDTVRSLASGYTLSQFVENLSLSGTGNIGGTGNDKSNVITGNAGSNAINGAGGADIIKAGAGNDILTGGLGADTFVFNTALSASTNIDTINDWDAGGAQDKIQLDDDIFLALGKVTATTALDATMFVKGTAALDANDHIIYDQTTGALYYDADGVGGAAQVQFATLVSNATLGTHPGAGLTAADFFVVI